MTVARLHRILTRLIANGHARKPVLVSKATFRSQLELDGVTLIDVEDVIGPELVPWADGDGSTMRADGTERLKAVVALVGDRYEPKAGAPAPPRRCVCGCYAGIHESHGAQLCSVCTASKCAGFRDE